MQILPVATISTRPVNTAPGNPNEETTLLPKTRSDSKPAVDLHNALFNVLLVGTFCASTATVLLMSDGQYEKGVPALMGTIIIMLACIAAAANADSKNEQQ